MPVTSQERVRSVGQAAGVQRVKVDSRRRLALLRPERESLVAKACELLRRQVISYLHEETGTAISLADCKTR